VNAMDIQLKSALHYAIQEHRFETTKLLLKFGADPFQINRYGDDALQTAALKVRNFPVIESTVLSYDFDVFMINCRGRQ